MGGWDRATDGRPDFEIFTAEIAENAENDTDPGRDGE